jgi:predicted esterase
MNTIMSMGNNRRFILVTPTTMMPGERLPVLFMWHWLGGTATRFLTQGNVQAAVNQNRFVAVIPEKKGDVVIGIPGVRTVDMVWPYLTTVSAARVNEELTFFDDMLACVSAQFTVDQDCISSVGVSAGALWTSQLLQLRSTRLASAIVLSGGIGPASPLPALLDVSGWRTSPAPRPVPTLVLWGGATDTCALNFQTASRALEMRLVANNSFVMECIHNCGHDVPPVEDPTLGVAALYRFAFDHPYWLEARESPYIARGLPMDMPRWCSIGPGSATLRTGMCDADGPACEIPGF